MNFTKIDDFVDFTEISLSLSLLPLDFEFRFEFFKNSQNSKENSLQDVCAGCVCRMRVHDVCVIFFSLQNRRFFIFSIYVIK